MKKIAYLLKLGIRHEFSPEEKICHPDVRKVFLLRFNLLFPH